MKVCLCSVSADSIDDFIDIKVRSEGELPIPPKIAISSLIESMISNGFTNWDYYDIDMLVPSDEEIEQYFIENKSDVIGLSAVVSSSYPQVEKISRIIRRVLPNSWIILGGNLSTISDIILKTTDVDICFVGEGEISWPKFLSYVEIYGKSYNIEELKKIAGISFLHNNEFIFTDYGVKISASDLTLPDYDILKVGLNDKPELMMNYFRIGKKASWFSFEERVHENIDKPYMAHFTTSKGCTARCTFCQRSIGGYRVFDLEKIEEHIIMLKEKFNVSCLSVFDENFGANIKHTHQLADIFKKHDMFWIASGVRCTNVGLKDLEYYKENNCLALKFGVESGSQDMLDIMEKKFSKEQVYEAITNCIDLDIYSPLALMLGMPGETDKTIMDTSSLVGNIAHKLGLPPEDMGYDIGYIMTFPGTPTYVYGQQIGVIGKTLDEEIKYLSSISQPIGTKYSHVNISGAKIKDIIFWDYLIKVESQRVYLNLNKIYGKKKLNKVYANITFAERIEKEVEVTPGQSKLYSKISRKGGKIFAWLKDGVFFKEILFRIYKNNKLFDFLFKHEVFTKLPASIIYPILKNSIYFKYKIFKYLGAFEDNLTENDSQLGNVFFNNKSRRKRSLREVIDLEDKDIDPNIYTLRIGK